MTKGRSLIAGLTILLMMGLLVGLSFIGPIFAQGLAAQTDGNANEEEDPAGETSDSPAESAGTQTVVFEESAYLGLEKAIEQAEADGVISAEQATQLLAMLPEFNEGLEGTLAFPGGQFELEGEVGEANVTAIEEITGHLGPGERDDHLAEVLQTAVENGLLTQEEADQILADLEAGNLVFLMVSDEGVFTDPADVPATLQDLLPEDMDPADTVIIVHLTNGGERSDIDIFSGGSFAPGAIIERLLPGHEGDTVTGEFVIAPDILADAVAEGLITAEQADAIRSYIQIEVEAVRDTRIVIGDEFMPDAFLLESLTARLQQAVENESITQAEADSLVARLAEILE